MKVSKQGKFFILFLFALACLSASSFIFANNNHLAHKFSIMKQVTQSDIQSKKEEMGSLSFTVSNQLPNPSSSLIIEICRFGIFDMDMMGCIAMPEMETIKFSKTRFYHVTRVELDKLLKRSDLTESAKVQFRFKDIGSDQSRFKACEEHPYTILDPNAHEKKFLIHVLKLDNTSYSCSIYKEDDKEILAEPKEEGLLGGVIHKFHDYKIWVQNDTGLTFSLKNRLSNGEPRLKVQVCSYKKSTSPPTCLTVGEDDYVNYNKSHVYHLKKETLDKIVAQAEGNNIQFKFKDTASSLSSYQPCWNEPSTHLAVLKGKNGYRFEIDVNKFDHVIYYTCRIRLRD